MSNMADKDGNEEDNNGLPTSFGSKRLFRKRVNKDKDRDTAKDTVELKQESQEAIKEQEWEKYTTGIGSKLLAKMGYVDGHGLGKEGNKGIRTAVEVQVRPKGMGLGHGDYDKKQNKFANISKSSSLNSNDDITGLNWFVSKEKSKINVPKNVYMTPDKWLNDLVDTDISNDIINSSTILTSKIIDMTGSAPKEVNDYSSFIKTNDESLDSIIGVDEAKSEIENVTTKIMTLVSNIEESKKEILVLDEDIQSSNELKIIQKSKFSELEKITNIIEEIEILLKLDDSHKKHITADLEDDIELDDPYNIIPLHKRRKTLSKSSSRKQTDWNTKIPIINEKLNTLYNNQFFEEFHLNEVILSILFSFVPDFLKQSWKPLTNVEFPIENIRLWIKYINGPNYNITNNNDLSYIFIVNCVYEILNSSFSSCNLVKEGNGINLFFDIWHPLNSWNHLETLEKTLLPDDVYYKLFMDTITTRITEHIADIDADDGPEALSDLLTLLYPFLNRMKELGLFYGIVTVSKSGNNFTVYENKQLLFLNGLINKIIELGKVLSISKKTSEKFLSLWDFLKVFSKSIWTKETLSSLFSKHIVPRLVAYIKGIKSYSSSIGGMQFDANNANFQLGCLNKITTLLNWCEIFPSNIILHIIEKEVFPKIHTLVYESLKSSTEHSTTYKEIINYYFSLKKWWYKSILFNDEDLYKKSERHLHNTLNRQLKFILDLLNAHYNDDSVIFGLNGIQPISPRPLASLIVQGARSFSNNEDADHTISSSQPARLSDIYDRDLTKGTAQYRLKIKEAFKNLLDNRAADKNLLVANISSIDSKLSTNKLLTFKNVYGSKVNKTYPIFYIDDEVIFILNSTEETYGEPSTISDLLDKIV